ncbi:MAG: DinB family protein [Anaerolineae bacterium]|nr:DinB family protein [Anaerolineae bacterium]
MITAENLIAMYARNLAIIKELTNGLTHDESLMQPPAPGNCINWVIGHIAIYRNNRLLKILEQPLVLDESLFSRYGRDSAPITEDGPDVVKLKALLNALDVAQERLTVGLRGLSPEQAQTLHAIAQFNMSAAEWALFLLRHEAMHTGNLDILREFALQART